MLHVVCIVSLGTCGLVWLFMLAYIVLSLCVDVCVIVCVFDRAYVNVCYVVYVFCVC